MGHEIVYSIWADWAPEDIIRYLGERAASGPPGTAGFAGSVNASSG